MEPAEFLLSVDCSFTVISKTEGIDGGAPAGGNDTRFISLIQGIYHL
jgi:hypothetical protein